MADSRTRALFFVVLSAAACGTAPKVALPPIELPQLDAANHPDLSLWWTAFGDARLRELVERTLANNTELVAAAARVEESAALVRNADDLLPLANVRAGVGRSQTSDRSAFPRFSGIDRRNNTFSVGLDVTYELDLWGRVRAGDRAVLADLAAQSETALTLASSLAAQTAQSYYRLVAIDRRLALLRDTIENRTEAVRIQQRRLDGGTGSELQLRQAQADLAGIEATIPRLVAAQASAERALGVLTGAQPRALAERLVARVEGLPLPPAVPSGLPADLLQRRPDIRAAEARLAAASARVDEARARYFPTISLTGSLGQESKDLSDLFVNPSTVWNLAAGLVQPLFGLRKIGAQVDAAEARRVAAEADYVHVVQTAFAETYDALGTLSASAEIERSQQQQQEALAAAVHIADLRNTAGVGAFLDLLDARRNLLQVETERIDTALERLTATIDVFRALGGGFDAGSAKAGEVTAPRSGERP